MTAQPASGLLRPVLSVTLWALACMQPAVSHAGQLRVGYIGATFSQYDDKDIQLVSRLWLREILDEFSHDVEFQLYDDMTAMVRGFEDGAVDLVVGDGLNIVRHFEIQRLLDGFCGASDTAASDEYVVVVPADLKLAGWSGIKAPVIALAENDPVAELYVRHAMLAFQNTEGPELVRLKQHNRALLNLFFGKANIAIVPKKTFETAVEMNPQMGRKLAVMEHTGLYARAMGFFRKGMDQEVYRDAREKVTNMNSDMRSKQMLMLYRSDKIVSTSIKDLEAIEKLDRSYQRLIQQKRSVNQ